ncbi:MAG TPA: hypothetical protein VFU86_02275 [Terriglobales bacterium]|nr:hypothetical protein [Terriglobales bacterium]
MSDSVFRAYSEIAGRGPLEVATQCFLRQIGRYIVREGKEIGEVLYPHRYDDGHYIASHTRYKEDQIEVGSEQELIDYLQRGYSIRMSSPTSRYHHAPSLIRPDEIEIIEGWSSPGRIDR